MKAINQSAISNIPCSSKWVSEFIKSVLSINKILKIFNDKNFIKNDRDGYFIVDN